jgi:hypothetical protein
MKNNQLLLSLRAVAQHPSHTAIVCEHGGPASASNPPRRLSRFPSLSFHPASPAQPLE